MNSIPEDATIDIDAEVTALLNAWCDRRMFKAIYVLYGGYRCLNGLTDGWEMFLRSLKELRGMVRLKEIQVNAQESKAIGNLIGVVSRALNVT